MRVRHRMLGWAAGFGLLAAMGAAQPAAAQGLFYKPMPFAGAGYKDKLRGPGRWWVRGFAGGGDLALNLALYRGALLMKASGFTHFMVVDGFIQVSAMNGNAELTFVGTNTPLVPIPCEAKPRQAANCRMLSVDETIATSGPSVFRTKEQTEGDLEQARAYVAAKR